MPNRGRTRRYALAATLALVLAGPNILTDARATEGLRITSLDVASAPGLQATAVKVPQKPSWRTSFGSERDTKAEPAGPVQQINADVVLLQGVTNLRALQKAFPGRSWRLIVSRQMVLTDDPVDPRSDEAVSNAPATAIAVRYQPGLRVAGQEHFLAHRSASTAPPDGTLAAQHWTAGTAARLNIGGRFAWITSLAFLQECAKPEAACPQREDFALWRQSKLDAGEAVIAGGLRHLPNPPGAAGPCSEQTVLISPARKDAAAVTARATAVEGLGCTAAAETGQAAAPHGAVQAETPP